MSGTPRVPSPMPRAERARLAHATYRSRLDARFWDRMDRSGGPDACWPWTSAIQSASPSSRGGYGYFYRYGRVVYAHRHALALSLGRALEPGEQALHACDNPPCCNPAHLFAGTHRDNMQDMAAKGRHVGTRGKRLPSHRRDCTERIVSPPQWRRRDLAKDMGRAA